MVDGLRDLSFRQLSGLLMVLLTIIILSPGLRPLPSCFAHVLHLDLHIRLGLLCHVRHASQFSSARRVNHPTHSIVGQETIGKQDKLDKSLGRKGEYTDVL